MTKFVQTMIESLKFNHDLQKQTIASSAESTEVCGIESFDMEQMGPGTAIRTI